MSSYARGHSTAWEQRQLGEVTEKVTEKNSGLAYQQVLTNSATHGIVRQSEYFDRIVAGKNHLDAYYVVNPNDYVYNPRISKEAQCGPINRNTLELTGIASPLYLVFRVSPQSLAYEFLDQYFKTANWFNYMKLQGNSGARSDRFTIADSDFFSMPVRIPSLPEQHHIGEFFSTLDKLIAAAERQEALLRQKKQAYLQLMFPRKGETQPRLRFSGFTEEWQELRLGKLYMKNTERNGNQFDAEKTLSVSSMTFNPLGNGAAEESLASYKILRIADAAFEGHTSNEFAFGRFVVNTVGAGIMSPRFASIRPTDFWWQSCDLDFWACYLHDEGVMKRILVRSTKRGTMMNELVFDDFFAGKMRVPSLPEQRLIGRFFSTLDSLISAAEKRAKHLRTLKGSYLQRMFV